MVIIGGVSGMGEAISLECAREGASVVTVSRVPANHKRAFRVINQCKNINRDGKFQHLQCNVTDKEATMKTMEEAAEFLGGSIDMLLCGNGSSHIGPTATMSEADLRDEFDNNFFGTFFACQAAFPFMKEKGGVILTSSATAASKTLNEYAAYITSKAAVQKLTLVLAKEWGKYNIRANCLVPLTVTPFTAENEALEDKKIMEQATKTLSGIMLKTNLSPWERVATTQEVANAVVFLVSDKATYITAQFINLSGGAVASTF